MSETTYTAAKTARLEARLTDEQKALGDFSCGDASLDRYLKEQAGQDLRRGCATPFVLVPKRGELWIIGYYALSGS
jgi:hypothetical protein